MCLPERFPRGGPAARLVPLRSSSARPQATAAASRLHRGKPSHCPFRNHFETARSPSPAAAEPVGTSCFPSPLRKHLPAFTRHRPDGPRCTRVLQIARLQPDQLHHSILEPRRSVAARCATHPRPRSVRRFTFRRGSSARRTAADRHPVPHGGRNFRPTALKVRSHPPLATHRDTPRTVDHRRRDEPALYATPRCGTAATAGSPPVPPPSRRMRKPFRRRRAPVRPS